MGGGYRTICGAVVVVLSLMVGSTMVRQQGPLPPPHPAVPSAPPLETTDRFYACIKQKQAKAELNCGSRCDVVFVGDSITEGLTSEYCYWNMTGISMCGLAFCPLYDDEGGRAFRQGFKPFKKSLIIAGAGDETQHTLAVLDAVLPVLKAPKVYSVLIGTNNIPAFSAPGNVSLVLQGITAVVARLRDAHPGSKVSRLQQAMAGAHQRGQQGGSVRFMTVIPVLVEATFAIILLGSGISVKFFPLYFVRQFDLTPLDLCLLNVAEPLGVAAATWLNPMVARALGQARYAVVLMAIGPTLLLGMLCARWFPVAAALLVLRTSASRAYIPLFQGIVFSCVPAEHRGKFASLSAFRLSLFSASAFVGAWLADSYRSYRPAFLVTAIWQYLSILIFVPVAAWVPQGASAH